MNKVKVALAQISCTRGEKTENLKKIETNLTDAKRQGADLIVFPELALTGYCVQDQIRSLAETIPGHSTNAVEEMARRAGMYVVFGMPEISNKARGIYNTAVLIGPEGLVGKYRKMHIPNAAEERHFHPGSEASVFDTNVGKLGLIICYDVFFPEVSRLMRLKGAELIVCVSASPRCDEGSPIESQTFLETLVTARAIENTAFVAYVNLTGEDEGMRFWGGSKLVGPNGRTLARAKYDDEDLLVGEVDYADIQSVQDFIPIFRDLRPELLDVLKKEETAGLKEIRATR